MDFNKQLTIILLTIIIHGTVPHKLEYHKTTQSLSQNALKLSYKLEQIPKGLTTDSIPSGVKILENWVPICNGFIITSRNVIAPAHCFNDTDDGKRIEDLNFQLGFDNKETSRIDGKIQIHPLFDRHQKLYDIAIIGLRNPEFLEFRAAEFTWFGSNHNTKNCLLWTSHSPISVTVLDKVECSKALKKPSTGLICAKNAAGIAKGHSGSALLCLQSLDIIAVKAILSYKIKSQDILVFTDVGFVEDWIEDNIDDDVLESLNFLAKRIRAYNKVFSVIISEVATCLQYMFILLILFPVWFIITAVIVAFLIGLPLFSYLFVVRDPLKFKEFPDIFKDYLFLTSPAKSSKGTPNDLLDGTPELATGLLPVVREKLKYDIATN